MTMQLNSVSDSDSKKEKQIADLKDELRNLLARNQTLQSTSLMEQAALNNSLENLRVMTDAQKKELQNTIDDLNAEVEQVKQESSRQLASVEKAVEEKASKMQEQEGMIES